MTSLLDLALPSERPRERCLTRGARALSLRECLALILGSGPRGEGCMGLAHRILDRPGTGLGEDEAQRAFFTALETSGEAHLRGFPGLGDARQAKILAAFELGRRYAVFREAQRFSIPAAAGRRADLPEQAIDRIPPEWRGEAQEWLAFVPFHRSRELGELCLVERGVRTHVNVDPVELFARVLALRPAGFFLFHNHPSGDMTPSPADLSLTRQVGDLSRQFGIRLMGHGIVTTLGERWIVV